MERIDSRHAALLMADPSACLRSLVLRELFARPPDDPEVEELASLVMDDPQVMDLLRLQEPDGAWRAGVTGTTGSPVRETAVALMRLGYLLGGDAGHMLHPRQGIRKGAEFLFSQQQTDGSWPLESGPEAGTAEADLDMVPLQTALPLRGLAACGYALDPRAERAYDWLLAQRLEDGAWPTGIASGTHRYVASYRRLPHSRWGCRSNTTGALLCLALHPERRHSPEARRALDLLLGRETREVQTLGFEVARMVGAEPVHGFLTFYARFDLGVLLFLCARVGASTEDPRVASLVEFIETLRGPYGLWEYRAKPQASRWVTFDLMRSLSRLADRGDREDWRSQEPPTPFQPYPKQEKRY